MKGEIEAEGIRLFIFTAIIVAFVVYSAYLLIGTEIKVRTAEASEFTTSYILNLMRNGGGIIDVTDVQDNVWMQNCKYEVYLRGISKPYQKYGIGVHVNTIDMGYLPVRRGDEIKSEKIIADVYSFPPYFCYIQNVWESGKSIFMSPCKKCEFRVYHDSDLLCIDDGKRWCKKINIPVSDYSGQGRKIEIRREGSKVVFR